jgi:5-methylcytosine-specific restriction endonuclease McrA
MGLSPKRKQILRIWERDLGICWLCGRDVAHPSVKWARLRPEQATRDHILAKSKGGPDTMDNLRLAHRSCNEARGDASGASV